MDPQLTLQSSIHLVQEAHRTALNRENPQYDPTSTETQSTFPTSGWAADELLNLAYERKVIDSLGRVTGDPFDIQTTLRDEIQTVADQLKYSPGYIPAANPEFRDSFKVYEIEFLNCIFELQKVLRAVSPPEIIGSAVAYFLGEQFYVRYLVERFKLSEEQAIRYLEPLLRLICKKPGDIDVRQYIRDETFLQQLNPVRFSAFFSDRLTSIFKKNNQHIDALIFLKCYFEKVAGVDEVDKRFGMARFGRFIDEIPLEYLVVDHTKRPFISFHKSLALTLSPSEVMGGTPRIGIRSYGDNAETALLQQSAFVFDAHHVEDIDWRGFLSVMAEMARCGFRTLNPEFIDGLWATFAQSKVDLKDKLQWAIDNHLLNRGESDEEKIELLSSFYMNLCVYLTERGELNEEMAAFLLYSSINPPEPLNHLKSILLTPSMTLQDRLAWFKLGMWVTFSASVPEGALSLNYGKLCYRIVMPKSGAVVWIPVDLANAVKQVKDSISESLLSKMKLFSAEKGIVSTYSIVQFQAWIDDVGTAELAAHLRRIRGSPAALKLALQIDLALIASGKALSLPDDWLKVLPQVFTEFPEEYERPYFHTLLSGKEPNPSELTALPPLKTICSERDWMLHLAQSSDINQAQMGLEWIRKSQNPELITSLEMHVWGLLQKKFALEADIAYLPIALFALACGSHHKGCRLEMVEGWLWQLCIGVNAAARKIPLYRRDLILRGLEFYRRAPDQKVCVQIISQILPDVIVDKEPTLLTDEEKQQLTCLAHEWILEKNELGLKLLLVLYTQFPDDHEILVALLKNTLSMEVEIRDLPWFLFALACGAFDCPLQRTKEGQFIFSQRKIPLFVPNIIESGLEHLEKNTKLLTDSLIKTKKSLLTNQEKGSIERFARKHLDQEVGIRLFLMLMKMDKSLSKALELLKRYPQLHLVAPYAIMHIGKVLFNKADSGSHLLGRCNPSNLTQWTAALLCHPNKKCSDQGKSLVKEMDADQQGVLWSRLADLLIAHRMDLIPEMIDALNHLLITPDTHTDFFLKWIDAIKATKNEKRMSALKSYLCQKQQMKDQKGKVLDWLNRARQTLAQKRQKPPELTLIERYQLNMQVVKKKSAELKNDEQFADYFLSLDVPLAEREHYRDLLKARLSPIQVGSEKKLALYVKFRFDDGRKWQDVLVEMEKNDLLLKERFLHLLGEALTPENDFGAYLWKQPHEEARGAWSELVRRHLRLVKSNLFEELPRITAAMFDGIPQGVPSHVHEFTCMSLILEFRAIESLVRQASEEERVEEVNQFINACAHWSGQELLDNRDEFFFQYWQANRFLWDRCGNRLVQAVLTNDPSEIKAEALAKIVVLLMRVNVESSVKSGLAALELLKGRPWLRDYLIGFVEKFFEQPIISMEGNVQELRPQLNSLFIECQYGRFPAREDLERDSRLIGQARSQMQILKILLQESETNPNGFHSMAVSAIPLLGWMGFLKQFLLPYNEKMSLASYYRITDEKGYSGENLDDVDFMHYTGLVFHRFKEQMTLIEFNDFLACYDASPLAKKISQSDHEMVKPWLHWLDQLRQKCQESQSISEELQLVESSKPSLERALEEIESATFDGSHYEKWLGHLHELMAAVDLAHDDVLQKQLFDRLENCINRVFERVFKEPAENHLMRFFNRYYNNRTIQRLSQNDSQRHITLMKRWSILIFMCDHLQVNDQDLQLNFFNDLKAIYIVLLNKGQSFDAGRRFRITEYFKAFLQKSVKSIDDLKVLQGIFRELEDKVPKKNLLGDPVEAFLEVALTMQYPIYEIPFHDVGIQIRPLLKSNKRTELNLAFHWLNGLFRQLSGEKADQMEPLLAEVFCHPESPAQFHVEPWMIQMASSEWLVRVIVHFKQILHPKVRTVISGIFAQYVSHFDAIQSFPKSSHLRHYSSFMNMVANAKSLFTLTKPPFHVPFDYDQAVHKILEAILTEHFPMRVQLEESDELDSYTFAELIMKFSDLMIRSMRTASYRSREEMEEKFKKIRQIYQNFYIRLCDLAVQDNDRLFLEKALAAWKQMGCLHADAVQDYQWVQSLLEVRLKHWKAYKMKAFLKRLEKAQFADDEKGLVFAKKASTCFKELLSSPASICSTEDLSLYFKHFIQFLTQRFQDKKAPGVILKDLLDALPQTDRLNFAPRSLNTVNLCIHAPLATFVKDASDVCKVAATLYRYIHSIDPLVVDTGFYWLGSILANENDKHVALNILKFLFDPAPRKLVPSVKFEGSNPGDILLEPWMISHGLSRFLVKAPEDQSKPVQESIQLLMRRYLDLYGKISALSEEMQIRVYGSFYSSLSSPAFCESELINDYQPYVDDAIRHIFELFLPKMKREDSRDSSGPIVAMGTRMIECLSIATETRDVNRSQTMSYFKQQFQFQDRIRNYAIETNDMALAAGALSVVKQLNAEPRSFFCSNQWDFNQGIAIHQMAIRTLLLAING